MPSLTLRPVHIGLDIGTSAVRGAELTGGSRRPTISRFGQVLLTPGAVRAGEIDDPDAVARGLSTLWKRAGFRSRRVRVGVSNRRIIVRQIEFPAMSRDDLQGALQYQAQEYIPIPLDDAVMDFEVADETVGPEGERLQRVVVVAAERAMVDRVVAALRAAKLDPVSLELSAYPLVRALGSAAVDQAEAIVDVGAAITSVVVQQGGRLRFVRILSSGGDELTEVVRSVLGGSWEEAESIKLRASPHLGEPQGLQSGASVADEDRDATDEGVAATERAGNELPLDPELDRAVDALAPHVDRFVDELRGSIEFYAAQEDASPIRNVVLCGGGAQLGGLASRLSAGLGAPVEEAKVFSKVRLGRVQLPADQVTRAEPFLGVSVGLALGGLEE